MYRNHNGDSEMKIVTVHISPYHAWQGYETEMPAWVNEFYNGSQ